MATPATPAAAAAADVVTAPSLTSRLTSAAGSVSDTLQRNIKEFQVCHKKQGPRIAVVVVMLFILAFAIGLGFYLFQEHKTPDGAPLKRSTIVVNSLKWGAVLGAIVAFGALVGILTSNSCPKMK